MNALTLTPHAEARMRQRGLRDEDLELLLRCAAQVGDDVLFLSKKIVDREITSRKKEIERLQRLRNLKVVLSTNTVVTCYRSRRRDQKRMLRKGVEWE